MPLLHVITITTVTTTIITTQIISNKTAISTSSVITTTYLITSSSTTVYVLWLKSPPAIIWILIRTSRMRGIQLIRNHHNMTNRECYSSRFRFQRRIKGSRSCINSWIRIGRQCHLRITPRNCRGRIHRIILMLVVPRMMDKRSCLSSLNSSSTLVFSNSKVVVIWVIYQFLGISLLHLI